MKKVRRENGTQGLVQVLPMNDQKLKLVFELEAYQCTMKSREVAPYTRFP